MRTGSDERFNMLQAGRRALGASRKVQACSMLASGPCFASYDTHDALITTLVLKRVLSQGLHSFWHLLSLSFSLLSMANYGYIFYIFPAEIFSLCSTLTQERTTPSKSTFRQRHRG